MGPLPPVPPGKPVYVCVCVCVHIFFKAAFGSFLALKRGSEVSEITHAEEILRIEPNLREGLLPGTFSVI